MRKRVPRKTKIRDKLLLSEVNILPTPISTRMSTTKFHHPTSVWAHSFLLGPFKMVQTLDRISRLFHRAEYHQDYQPFRPPNVATGASLNYQDEAASDASPLQLVLVVVGVAVLLFFLTERYAHGTPSCFKPGSSAIWSRHDTPIPFWHIWSLIHASQMVSC